MNCRNLKTVNGGKQLEKVKDRAFMNCPLSQVEIPATVEEIGLGAYAISGGTDTAVFTGNELPVLSVEQSARRLANQEYRTLERQLEALEDKLGDAEDELEYIYGIDD